MKNQLFVMLILLFAGFSCKNKSTEIHEHENNDVKIYLTEYSEHLEVFSEADPFIVGEQSTILAHFTQLSDFKPISESSVTVSLIVGSKGIRQTQDKKRSAGIYSFVLKPESAGVGKMIFEIKNSQGDYKVVVNNVEVFADKHSAIHAAEESSTNGVNQINFTKEQSWKIEFETANPEIRPFGEIIKTTAQFLPTKNDQQIISSKTNGFVMFAEEMAEGMEVLAGQVIATIVGNELAENNISVRLQEAKNNFELLKANYERGQKLATENIISEKELLQFKTDYENAKSGYDNLKQNFNKQGQTVKSNHAGFVSNLMVTHGQFVESGQALFSISSNKSLLLRAEVSQRYSDILTNIESATFKVPGNQEFFSLTECNGILLSYGKSTGFDNNYMIPVTFRVENNPGFIPGAFVDIFIKTKSNDNKLIVPNSSLIEEQGSFFVFVQITPELFEKRQVKTGSTDGVCTEIIGGLKLSERIVSKGAVIVKLAAVSNSLDPHAGHVH
ncbi:MAG: efflux RND transporter periplasmic adaptor subunit [Bacteroidales bacterium]